jgi:hypothetical protein
MAVIRHEAPGVDAPAGLEAGFIKAAQEGSLGARASEDRGAVVAPIDDVIGGVFGFEAEGTGARGIDQVDNRPKFLQGVQTRISHASSLAFSHTNRHQTGIW